MPEPRFGGFPPEGIGFLAGLAETNTKAWFDSHRRTYQEAVQGPAKALVVDLGEELRERISPGIRAEPRVGRSLFRINRDLRFSKDKTPYNPWIDMVFWEGDGHPRRSPGLILRITPAEIFAGAGVFGMRDAVLDGFRRSVVDESLGPRLAGILVDLEREITGIEISRPTRARVPAGYPVDHPRADLLRYEALHATIREPLPAAIGSRRFVDWCATRHERVASLHRWLVDALVVGRQASRR